jgi:putative addiction module component (TIGR02574 family)
MDFATTLTAIRAMNIDDRIRLVQAVWDEIAADNQAATVSEEQRQELERRLLDDETNPDDVVPWETIKAEARSRVQR